MANSTRTCKICGKEYPYCKTELKNGEIFRWQDVACCPEHGSEYFALIAASREKTPAAGEKGTEMVVNNTEPVYLPQPDQDITIPAEEIDKRVKSNSVFKKTRKFGN